LFLNKNSLCSLCRSLCSLWERKPKHCQSFRFCTPGRGFPQRSQREKTTEDTEVFIVFEQKLSVFSVQISVFSVGKKTKTLPIIQVLRSGPGVSHRDHRGKKTTEDTEGIFCFPKKTLCSLCRSLCSLWERKQGQIFRSALPDFFMSIALTVCSGNGKSLFCKMCKNKIYLYIRLCGKKQS